ncbi:MAG TPA: hypothetical protein VG500_00245 [Gemmatimonadales bacterium]|jgi:hypothetical protein|nr:hypothetical protein [Gemmatimonadales bacterium]
MHQQEHSTVREGILVGLLGAAIVAAWYFVFDLAAGRPFHTPNVLGKVFFRGDLDPGVRRVVPGVVAGYTVLHVILFALIGMLLTHLVHLTTRNPAFRMGLWMGLVVTSCFVAGLTLLLSTATGERVPLWTVVGGSLLGVGTMGAFLWRRHPALKTGQPLGDEVRTSPHPPGAPGGG